MRIAREATLYTQFRTAFGVPVSAFPLMINQAAMRTAAGAFKVYSEYIHFGEKLIAGIRDLERIEDITERKRRFRLRELIMLQKIVVCDEAPALIRMVISFFGGHATDSIKAKKKIIDLLKKDLIEEFNGKTLT